MKTLTNEEKWAEVDLIINRINKRKARGQYAYLSDLDRYIDREFNKSRDERKNNAKESN